MVVSASSPPPCPRGRALGAAGRRPAEPQCSRPTPRAGLRARPSEERPPVRVVPAPAPLVSHVQVLLLDPLEVLQQLRVVDARGVCFLRPGCHLHTVSVQGGRGAQRQGLSASGGCRRGPQAGGAQPRDTCPSGPTNPQLFAPKSGVLQSTPSPTAGGTSQHCRLDKALSLWAGNGAQSRHHIGKHFLFMSGSLWGESQGQQPARKPAGAWNRVQGDGGGAGLRPGTTGMAEVHWPSTWQDICF